MFFNLFQKNNKTIIFGLGNKDKEYEKTPHNIGKEFLIYFQEKESFPAFSLNKNINGYISQKDNIILVIPNTYMNVSGICVAKAIKYFKTKKENIIVIHDDADLFIPNFKISNTQSAGHKGIESIFKNLKFKDFYRIRIGVRKEYQREKALDLVLKKFTTENYTEVVNNFDNIYSKIKELI
ncbi:MAG: aminoacyl-tRNA hydrolase [Candidatus Pacebacteria bacterium]|nr:aminoacyl-tRNA hydrolase [Candidatus Paceibacterota bacterium]